MKPMKPGRPSKYSKELTERICERIIAGESIRSMCKDEDMPDAKSIFSWLVRNEDFLQQYTRAREIQAELIADEILEIADDGTNDFMERETKKGTIVLCDHENINRSRLRVDARKWVAAKLLPKKYGEKTVTIGTAPVLDIGNLPLPDARTTSKPN